MSLPSHSVFILLFNKAFFIFHVHVISVIFFHSAGNIGAKKQPSCTYSSYSYTSDIFRERWIDKWMGGYMHSLNPDDQDVEQFNVWGYKWLLSVNHSLVMSIYIRIHNASQEEFLVLLSIAFFSHG
jgi:hypothetical protein